MDVCRIDHVDVDTSGEILALVSTHSNPENIVTCCENQVLFFDVRSKANEGLVGIDQPNQQGLTLSGACFRGDDAQSLLISRADGLVWLYDTRKLNRPVYDLQCRVEDEINGLWAHPNNHFCAATDDQGAVHIIDAQRGRVFKRLPSSKNTHTLMCSSAAFLPRNNWEIFTGGMDCLALRWIYSKQRAIERLHFSGVHSDCEDVGKMFNPPLVHHLCINHSGNQLAVALGSGEVQLYSVNQSLGERKHRLQLALKLNSVHTYDVSRVAFVRSTESTEVHNPNECLISCGNDRRLCLWDIGEHKADRSEKAGEDNLHIDSRVLHVYRHHAKCNDLRSLRSDTAVFADTQGGIYHINIR